MRHVAYWLLGAPLLFLGLVTALLAPSLLLGPVFGGAESESTPGWMRAFIWINSVLAYLGAGGGVWYIWRRYVRPSPT